MKDVFGVLDYRPDASDARNKDVTFKQTGNSRPSVNPFSDIGSTLAPPEGDNKRPSMFNPGDAKFNDTGKARSTGM